MPIALGAFAVFIIVASAIAMVFPSELMSFVLGAISGPGIWLAAFARVLLAILLWFSATTSRTPVTFKVLAILALSAALFIVVFGTEGVTRVIDWLNSLPLWLVRLQSVFGVAFGVFLLWSISSKRNAGTS